MSKFDTGCMYFIQRLTSLAITQFWQPTPTMQLSIFLLAQQLSAISALRVLENGLGLPVYGAEETIVDYALLAADQKANLPSQVQSFSFNVYKS